MIDSFIIGITIFSIAMGFYKGFIWELLKYAAFACASVVAIFAVLKVFPMVEHNEYAFLYLAGVGLLSFLVTSSSVLYFINRLSVTISKTAFGSSNRIFGAVLGAVKASVFNSLLYSGMMIATSNHKPVWLGNSVFNKPLDYTNNVIQNQLQRFASTKIKKLLNLQQQHAKITNLIQ